MRKSPSASHSPQTILANLPRAEYRRVAASLEPVALPSEHILLTQGRPADRVYFLCRGVCSITRQLSDGRSVEIALIGREGLVGVEALVAGAPTAGSSWMRIADREAFAMSAQAFRREMRLDGAFAALVHRYTQCFVASLMHSVACNAVHPVEQRTARWLLTMGDRVGSNAFPFTQESLSAALGVRRPTVTLAVSALSRRGLIDYGAGGLIIRDRAALRSVACDCYQRVK